MTEPQVTIQDHYIGILKLALEFNTHVIQVATEVVAMDSSGHNRKTLERVQEKFAKMNANYIANLGMANKAINEQFGQKPKSE